jgi:HicB_like antitoxin of bacterial toxin-antitoxin system
MLTQQLALAEPLKRTLEHLMVCRVEEEIQELWLIDCIISYWADIPELPGCFASGDTLDELFKSLQEGVALYLADDGPSPEVHVATATFTDRPLVEA